MTVHGSTEWYWRELSPKTPMHGQAGRADKHSQPGKTCPDRGKMERQGWWVFPGTVLFDTLQCLREPSPATPSEPDKTVSAVTVHGSTEWCCRELSPKTPTERAVGLTSPHSRKKQVRAAERWSVRVGGCCRGQFSPTPCGVCANCPLRHRQDRTKRCRR